jgi:hypothetical protein
VVVPPLALLFVAVLCRASVEAFARFGRPPNGVAWLVPSWLARAMVRWFGLLHIDAGDAFAGFAGRKIIAVAGGVELDARLFEDRLWPLLFSPDDQDRSRLCAANMATAALRSPLKRLHCRRKLCRRLAPRSDSGSSPPLPAGAIPSKGGMDRGVPEAQRLRGRLYRHSFTGVLAVWEEMNAPEWQGRKLNNAEIARRAHNRVVKSGQGFRSTELNEGKASDEPLTGFRR